MRILGIERDESACNHYRILQPLYKLLEHGMAKILTLEEGPQLKTDFAINKMLESDVIVLHRPASDDWFEFIKICRKYGKIIVCDYDDDPFNTHPMNPYYQFIGTEEVKYRWPDGTEEMLWSRNPAESGGRYIDIDANIRRRDLFRSCFKKADMVTTTTPILAEKLKQINPNTVVLPNLVDFSQYPEPMDDYYRDPRKKKIRIGWQGGSSHYEDLCMIAPAIKKILRKYPETQFVYWGDLRMYGLFREVPIQRIDAHQWVKHLCYPYKLTCMNLDIGLCPIVDNEFNRNKSAIKYFEYSVVKCASVASKIPPYEPCITHGENGLLAGPDEWFDAIESLIVDEKKRREIGQKAYENVYENYNADRQAYLWLNAYESIAKKDLTDEPDVCQPTEQAVPAVG